MRYWDAARAVGDRGLKNPILGVCWVNFAETPDLLRPWSSNPRVRRELQSKASLEQSIRKYGRGCALTIVPHPSGEYAVTLDGNRGLDILKHMAVTMVPVAFFIPNDYLQSIYMQNFERFCKMVWFIMATEQDKQIASSLAEVAAQDRTSVETMRYSRRRDLDNLLTIFKDDKTLLDVARQSRASPHCARVVLRTFEVLENLPPGAIRRDPSLVNGQMVLLYNRLREKSGSIDAVTSFLKGYARKTDKQKVHVRDGLRHMVEDVVAGKPNFYLPGAN